MYPNKRWRTIVRCCQLHCQAIKSITLGTETAVLLPMQVTPESRTSSFELSYSQLASQQRTWFARRGVLRPRRICSAASRRFKLLSTLSTFQRSIQYSKIRLTREKALADRPGSSILPHDLFVYHIYPRSPRGVRKRSRCCGVMQQVCVAHWRRSYIWDIHR